MRGKQSKIGYVVILLVGILLTRPAHACEFATQQRSFPIGYFKDGIAVLEFKAKRRFKGEVEVIGWMGDAYVRVYDYNLRPVDSIYLDIVPWFSQMDYDSVLHQLFDKSLHVTQTWPGFTQVRCVDIQDCLLKPDCSIAKLQGDSVHQNIDIVFPSGDLYPIQVFHDTTSYAYSILDYYGYQHTMRDSLHIFTDLFCIGSLRTYMVGDFALYVMHITTGQLLYDAEDQPIRDQAYFREEGYFVDASNGLFIEGCMHHAQGFDYLFMEF